MGLEQLICHAGSKRRSRRCAAACARVSDGASQWRHRVSWPQHCGGEPFICFIDPILKACVSPSSEVHQRELSQHGGCTRCVFRNGGTRTLGGWRLGESSVGMSPFVRGEFTFQAPLPSVIAAGDPVGSRKIRGAHMKKDRKMSSCIPWTKRQICIIELVATM